MSAEVQLKKDSMPKINPKLCIGCRACSNVCPSNAIVIKDDLTHGTRSIILDLSYCIGCRACGEACIKGAIEFIEEVEFVVLSIGDLTEEVTLKLAKCPICGNYSEFTEKQIEEVKKVLTNLPDETAKEVTKYFTLCRKCRRRYVLMNVSELSLLRFTLKVP